MPSRIDPTEVQDDRDYFARRDQELLALRYPRDPVGYAETILGVMLTDTQKEILRALLLEDDEEDDSDIDDFSPIMDDPIIPDLGGES